MYANVLQVYVCIIYLYVFLGAFGIVYKGLYRKNDETIIVAIKTLKSLRFPFMVTYM